MEEADPITLDQAEISVLAEVRLRDEPKRSWSVHLQNRKTGKKSQRFTLEDPFDRSDYDEVRWYVEDYAIKDPYARQRAVKASNSQTLYGRALLTSLAPYMNEILDLGNSTSASDNLFVNLWVHGDGTQSSLHGLLWELLERNESAFSFFVTGISEIQPDNPSPERDIVDGKSFNILYVAARPEVENDISYRAISRQLVQMLKSTSQKHRTRFQFCRPGTWARLRDILTAPDALVYDLVHFDTHGSIAKSQGQDKAVLHFSQPGGASTRPDRKTSEAVAKLLARCHVRYVVLNACKSATTRAWTAGNLACTMASHGIRHVIGMRYTVEADAAALAMQSLYRALLRDPHDLPGSLRSARREMRTNLMRTARFGLEVACEDDFNLALYSSSETAAMRSVATESATAVGQTQPQGVVPPEESTNKVDASNISRIQDLDMLSLENTLDYARVVFVSGGGGTGKSTFAKHLREWWDETGFAEHVEYVDHLGDHNGDSILHDDASASPKEAGSPNSMAKEQPFSHHRIVLLDNVESFDPWPEEAKDTKNLDLLKQVVTKLSTSADGTRVVVFTRLQNSKLSADFPDISPLDVSVPSPKEAFAAAMSLIPGKAVDISPERASVIEDVIKGHRMNLAFVSTFLPSLVGTDSSPYRAIEGLLDTPALCLDSFDILASKATSPSAFGLASDLISSWPLPKDLARRMILPFCMFRHQMPVDSRPWLYKLREVGCFSGGRPAIEPYAVETGRIHDWALDKDWTNFPSDWTFEESFRKVHDCLNSLGFLKENPSSGQADGVATYLIHPLLPYFLRSEIGKLESVFTDAPRYYLSVRRGFWEYYENLTSDRIQIWTNNPEKRVGIVESIQADAENMFEAIRLGLEQPIFPFRSMKSHLLVSTINFLAMPQPRARRWAILFGDVITRFERITKQGEWKTDETGNKIPPEETRQRVFISAVHMAEQTGRVLEALRDREGVIANADRAGRLLEQFSPLVDVTSGGADKVMYGINVQKVKCTLPSDWTAQDMDTFAELLSSPTPDLELEGDEGKCKLARAELANHLLFERASIPDGHPVRELIAKYAPQLDSMISSIYADHVGLSQLGSLSSRDFFIQLGRAETVTGAAGDSPADYTTRGYAADVSRRVQRSFESQPPSNSRGYFVDAVAFAMDPDAVARGDTAIFDGARLQSVYEKAKRVRYTELEAFCLQQLAFRGVLDGDATAAEMYFQKFAEIGGVDALPKEMIFDSDVKRQEEFRQSLLDNMRSMKLDEQTKQE
jgi:hypothetical protein